jgi:ABC-2 type transport system ATP-binding protein/lipopolysaccharide transport system ATP-binding protein
MTVGEPIRLEVHDATVDIPIYEDRARSIKNRVIRLSTGGLIMKSVASVTVVRALEGVCLELRDGDKVALVGHNGSGKTTLLRLMAGIYRPTAGRVIRTGRCAALFDTSFGMDYDASGHENILLRGLALGLSRREVEGHVDEIVEFSELGDFIDLPVRTYSAGMAARLAFAITTSIQPDILLIDEGLGAGDASFIERAHKRLTNMASRVRILVVASHNEVFLSQFCERAILLNKGRVAAVGSLKEVLDKYHLSSAPADEQASMQTALAPAAL